MLTLDDIRDQLMIPSEFHGNAYAYALPMVDAIELRTQDDPAYSNHVQVWLDQGGTVLLRDEICDCFREADFVMAEQGSILDGKHPYAFNDMWMAIDTARHLVRIRSTSQPEHEQ